MYRFARILLSCIAAAVLLPAVISADLTPQERYVRKYAMVAGEEMYRSGVPASITLAQGLLESRYGLSALATEGHNHFGIKCHNDWKGKTMKVDDDAKGECFRVYDEDAESFMDHSDFLRYRERYKFLFDIPVTDYRSWAAGLKKAGYATDPAYPAKLTKLIEDYGLDRFDTASPSDFEKGGKYEEYSTEHASFATLPESSGKVARKEGKSEKKTPPAKETKKSSKAKKDKHKEEAAPVIPESPYALEEARLAARDEVAEVFRFSTARPVYKINGVPCIYSIDGESWKSIAEDNNIILRQLLYYNDLRTAGPLPAGTTVFLQAKKSHTSRGLDKYIVENDGESLRDICQRFGVKMKSINKLNGFAEGHALREGDTILLRKQ